MLSTRFDAYALTACLLVLSGCQGELTGNPGNGQPDGTTQAGASGGGFIGGGGATATSCAQPSPPAPMTRLARLAHRQYDGAASVLLQKDVHPSEAFAPDPPSGGFDNNADALRVVDRQGRDYRAAAEKTAATLAQDAALLASFSACASPNDTSCGAAFVEAFGRVAFRRPLDSEEKTRYLALYTKGATLISSGTVHARGSQLVVEAMLQSPHFLYRVEVNDAPDASGNSRLSGYEVAARLSFAFWNQSPDSVLAGAAASALTTPDEVAEQAERLLTDARAKPVLEDFHRQWLGTDVYSNITRDAQMFPEFGPTIGAALKEETRRFVDSVTFDRGLGLQGLLTDTTAFVNADLAKLYDVQGNFGADLTEVSLDPTQRAGFLTRIGFLAENAHASSSSPILRGAHILKRVMCFEFPPTPPGATTTPFPPFSDTIRTGRDQVTKLTEAPTCAGCHHTMINPMGFAFEGYDAVGKVRTADRGFPLDLKGTLAVADAAFDVDGPIDASKKIAESQGARSCYATNWLRYVYARVNVSSDACTVDALAAGLKDALYGTKRLLADLTRTPSFLYRSKEAP